MIICIHRCKECITAASDITGSEMTFSCRDLKVFRNSSAKVAFLTLYSMQSARNKGITLTAALRSGSFQPSSFLPLGFFDFRFLLLLLLSLLLCRSCWTSRFWTLTCHERQSFFSCQFLHLELDAWRLSWYLECFLNHSLCSRQSALISLPSCMFDQHECIGLVV